MTPSSLALVALFGPVAAALIIAVVPPIRRPGRPALALSILAATASFVAAIGLLVTHLSGAGLSEAHDVPWLVVGGRAIGHFGVRLDGISVIMLVVVCAVALAVQVYSAGYLHDEPPASLGRYYGCQSLFLFAMNLLVLAPDLLQLFAGWELVGLASYLLIGYWYRKPEAARAALKAFWITKLADSGLILALVLLFFARGDFAWDPAGIAPALVVAITLLLLLAVAGKSAQFPLHVWLPDAMEGPTPVSALLHAATMVAAGVYLVVRAFPLFEAAPPTMAIMAHVGAFTALFAACIAVVQSDIKRVLAYSTCSQLGYMFAALGAGGLVAGFFHLTTHAAFKAMLFLAAGNVIHAIHSNELADMGGLAKRMRWTAFAWIVGTLALVGIPGFSGFFSKDMVLEAVSGRGFVLPLALLVITTGLTAFYMGRVAVLAFFGKPSPRAASAHESGASMLLPVVLLAIPSIALGWLAGPLARSIGEDHHFHLGAVGLAALAAALAGLALAWLVHGSKAVSSGSLAFLAPAGRVVRSSVVDSLHLALYRSVMLRVGSAAGWVDRYVVDAVMNVVGASVVAGGRRLRATQTGDVSDYVWMVLAATALVAAWGALR